MRFLVSSFLFSTFTYTILSESPDSWYKKYSEYPEYCSTPSMMEARSIPDVPDSTKYGESSLVHVSLVIRHGSRTPYKADLNCWDGYQKTNVWDCDLTTMLAPPSPKDIDREEEKATDDSEAMFLYEKRYDALQFPLRNELNGTCQQGQLLLQGYEQELTNGKHIRQAYVYDRTKYNHNMRMRLLDTSSKSGNNIWDDDQIYLRADDDQRTLMSGQVLLRGLLGPEIDAYFTKHHDYPILPLHTADRHQDILDANEVVCPRLAEIRERFLLSSDFQAFNASEEANAVRHFQQESLQIQGAMDAVDCLGTTICTDRDLPSAINDYSASNPSSWFRRLFQFDSDSLALLYKHNNAEYAKVAMGPLWSEIITNIDAFLQDEEQVCCPERKRAKLALFSAHDTTIMPLLVSLGVFDGQWTPYASLLSIEIHEVNIDGFDRKVFRSNFAFRLIYNGVVLTQNVEGCPKDLQLCDADVLMDMIRTFVVSEADCQRKYGVTKEYTDTLARAREVVSTPGGIVALVALVLGSAIIGAVLCYVYLTGSLPRKKKNRKMRIEDDGIALNGGTNGHYHDEEEDNPVLT